MTEGTEGTLAGKEIVVIVGGGIAAYKTVTLVRELQRAGARVETVLTDAAQKFVGAVTFAGITSRAPRIDLWDPSFAGELHIELTSRADAIVVAPATADLMARSAAGMADDLATTVLLSARGPVLMAPAMHPRMWNHAATVDAVAKLQHRGVRMVGPVDGPLASGESGIGRMAEPEAIAREVSRLFHRDLEGLRVLVSAGPTYEPLDPVRFVGNRSSGRMGFALAERARSRGANVTLVHGPVSIARPAGVTAVSVRTAIEMREAILTRVADNDVVVMSAAVADYRPAEVANDKIKKGLEDMIIRLVKNPDILSELGALRGEKRVPVLVGFAVESKDLVGYARAKLQRKGCDLVVANLAQHGFEGDDNIAVLVDSSQAQEMGRMSKISLADAILDRVKSLHSAAVPAG